MKDECDVKEKCFWFKQEGDRKCRQFACRALWQNCRAHDPILDLLSKDKKEETDEPKAN